MTNFTMCFDEDLKTLKLLQSKFNESNDLTECYALINAISKLLVDLNTDVETIMKNQIMYPTYISHVIKMAREETKIKKNKK